MKDKRERMIDAGELCMEFWGSEGDWIACTYPPLDKSPLCERHYGMAMATIAAGRRAR